MTERENGQLPEYRYLDQELAWLDFNNRMLDLVRDARRIPLLERVKFLAIFSDNPNEFFMMWVAGLKCHIQAGAAAITVTGTRSSKLHVSVLERTAELVAEQSRLFQQEIRPQLRVEGTEIPAWDELTAAGRDRIRTLLGERIFPVLTPLAVDPSHPFPYISGLLVSLAVLLRNPTTDASQSARVRAPTNLSWFVKPTEGRFVPPGEIISRHLGQPFTGMEMLYHATLRAAHNEDIEVEEDDAENLLCALEKELPRRKVGYLPVRPKVEGDIDETMFAITTSELGVASGEVFHLLVPPDLTGLFALENSCREDLEYLDFLPIARPDPAEVESSSPADTLKAPKRRGALVQHPYDSFATSVQWFIEQTATDPAVLTIKQTLYCTSDGSPIVNALIEAAQTGKQALVVAEIKARFDGQNNISRARQLKQVGVHIIYGMVGLKTHCKLSLVVHEKSDGLCRYVRVGTGNCHPKTVRSYEDMGLSTTNPVITDDMARLFNYLSGITHQIEYRRLLVTPHDIHSGLLECVETEIANHAAGLPLGICIKANSIADEAVIDTLYHASQARAKVGVWVWGICTIRPGVKGLSENIRVRSILGRLLEHPRICWLEAGGKPNVGTESADLMHCNLGRHVEAIAGLPSLGHIAHIRDPSKYAFDDRTVHWKLQDRTWSIHTTDPEGRPLSDLQEEPIRLTRGKRHR